MLHNTKILRLYNKCEHFRKKSYSSNEYCLNLVRAYDNENFLCTLLLPSELRASALAIRSFNVEVAGVQDQVSQPHLGVMRLKFWDDCIDKIYNNKVPNNPVAVELSKAVKRHSLSKELLKKLVACRTKRLDQPSFSSISEMEAYADASCSSVFLLLLEAAKVKNAKAESVAISLGKAQGLTILLRGLQHNVQKRTLALPSDLLAHHDVSEESVFRGNHTESLQLVVKRVVDNIEIHLHRARELKDDIPIRLRCLFLPAIPTSQYINSLRLRAYNAFDTSLQQKNLFLPVSLYFNSLVKNY